MFKGTVSVFSCDPLLIKGNSLFKNIENRIYIRGEFKESLGMIFFSPFQPEREFKVYKSCKCSLDYFFQFRIFKLLNKLYNELAE